MLQIIKKHGFNILYIFFFRKKLLGDNSGALQSIFENTEEEKMMNALVVLDEFGKELAAICLVKYHLYSQ